jgi:hypothetical protein
MEATKMPHYDELRKCGIYTQWNFTQVTEKNEILSFAGKCMELENILSEVNQAQKFKSHMFSLICGIYA